MNQSRRVEHESGTWSRASTIVLGLLLIGAGLVLLAVNVFGMVIPIDFDQIGWPVFVIAPGVILLIVGLISRGEGGVGLSVAGAIVTTIGLILAYQRATDHWASWAYAWALIAPTSVGAAMAVWGLLHRSGAVLRQGLSALAVGLVLFIIGFAFFEGVLNISGSRGLAPLGRQALPIALIIAGGLVILSRVWPRSRPKPAAPAYTEWAPGSYGTAYAPAPEPPPPPAPPSAPFAAPPPLAESATTAPSVPAGQPPWPSSSGAESTVSPTAQPSHDDEETTA